MPMVRQEGLSQRALDEGQPRRALRPEIRARSHAISSGHYLASMAGMRIIDDGGIAVDAGVAAGICLGILLSDSVSFAGVAPILVYDATRGEVESIAGVGNWPAAATLEEFRRRWGGDMPKGVSRLVVPAAPDAWITALRRWGTRSFGEVAAAAIELASDGFPMYELMAMRIAKAAKELASRPSSAALFLPNGGAPLPGERFYQREAAATLERMASAEARASHGGRDAGLQAARDEFYRGETAERISRYVADEGGLLTAGDLAGYEVKVAPPVSTAYRGWQVYACGPWSQGPALSEALNIVQGLGLSDLEHNSPQYLHLLLEALKLAFADREAYFGDPLFVDVPIDVLLSPAYAESQRARIDRQRAAPALPAAGDAGRAAPHARTRRSSPDALASMSSDTTYVCAIDRWGNVFSATPSDGFDGPVVPGVGMAISPRGSQSWLDPEHPSVLAPGKRPRLTPNPAIALRDGVLMPFGTPGGDVQVQAMLQVFLNVVEFGMTPQEAVEAPRAATYSAPDSFWPHASRPGLVRAESRLDPKTLQELAALGHTIEQWPAWGWEAGAVNTIVGSPTGGLLTAGADPRREPYALGW